MVNFILNIFQVVKCDTNNKHTISQIFQIVGEYGDYIEGDMILTEAQKDALFSPARNGFISIFYHWPHKRVYYQLSHEHTKEQRDYIELALKKMESVSCLKFLRRTNQKDYIEITVC